MTVHSGSLTAVSDGPQSSAAERIKARYGAPPSVLPPSWNETLDVLLNHRSSRAYLPTALPQGTVELLVAAAQSAPTSSNLQAWSVVAVEDPERKARLEEFAAPNPQINAAPLFLVWLVDLARLRAIARSNDSEGAGLDYLESFVIGAIDAALAAQNAVAAIDSLGLGSCYIGGIRNRPEDVARELNLPPETIAVFGLTVGYPDPAVKTDVKPRLPQSAVLFREQYDTVSEQDLVSYDERLRTFQKGQNMPEAGWTSVIAKRIGSAAALKGRVELTAILRRFGFALK
ncbi:NADPH-dependent oxidoreductase [Agrobacterium vitis]|uniref:NADPH-dependent oxidoreductase n=1 Tax=Agrobacterium vitis TaxID=373 RepID=UPI0012E7C176|nr:NADPH-dependent oxidoreductase [Agrobacterium vitis]MVA51032.1 NADPH-dependent oxidoreductase [Agrobacterium vitis]NSZ55587.1 NADPH-dependent oxidoreductase [Agrobacterium vitis]NTA34838.1 NADPH-dependent oxidoreductase [Agrobacterium vitis]